MNTKFSHTLRSVRKFSIHFPDVRLFDRRLFCAYNFFMSYYDMTLFAMKS